MKKLLLTLAAAMVFSFANAQRSVDWSVEEIILPTQLNSTAQGTAMQFEVVMKNNGADQVNKEDTMGFQFYMKRNGSTIYAAPNGSLFLALVGKDMASGDTMHFRGTVNMPIGWNLSINIELNCFALVYDRGTDIMTLENQAGLANNTAKKNMVWYNQQGWGVSVNEVNVGNVSVYPNPSSDVINVNFNAYEAGKNFEVKLTDINGRVVYSNTFATAEEVSINVADLSKGIYILNVVNGSLISNTTVNVR